jgi:uncharacterized protein (TIGR03437 family)
MFRPSTAPDSDLRIRAARQASSRLLLHLSQTPLQRSSAIQEIPAEDVSYVGVTPFSSGLYQVNVRVPSGIAGDVPVRLRISGVSTPVGAYVNVGR